MSDSVNKSIIPHPIPPDIAQTTIDHFLDIKWVRPVLLDPQYFLVSFSRTVTPGLGHTFFARTLNSHDTIKELLSLVRRSPSPSEPLVFPESKPEAATVVRFYSFGDGLNAHPGLAHGGIIACVLDSSLGAAVSVTMLRVASEKSGQRDFSYFTVQLNTTYKKPIETPGTIMVQSWVTKVEGEGRKVWAKGLISGEGGVVHAEAEGLWLRAKQNSGKL